MKKRSNRIPSAWILDIENTTRSTYSNAHQFRDMTKRKNERRSTALWSAVLFFAVIGFLYAMIWYVEVVAR